MTLVSVSINAYTFLQTFTSLSVYFWKHFLSWLSCQCVHLPQGLFVLWLSRCSSGSSGFPGGGSDGNESGRHATDPGSVPGWGGSPGGEHGSPLQYSCLENSMDRGAWRATVHGVPKSQTQLSD